MNANNRRNELFVEAMSFLMKDKLGRSMDLLEEILNDNADDKLALMARGTVKMKLGSPQSAILDFNRVIELDARNQKAYHLRGLAKEMTGDQDGALTDFNQAISINPGYGAAYYSRATLLTKMGSEEEAVEDMKVINQLTDENIEHVANEYNLWRSRHMQMESLMGNEMQR